MKWKALGTLWSPRCTTDEPTQPPMRDWHLRAGSAHQQALRGALVSRARPARRG